MRGLRFSLLPAAMAFAAFFAVLPHSGANATVRMIPAGDGWQFRPSSVRIEAGERVGFRNDSDVTHTAACVGCPWDSGDVQPGQTKMLSFPDRGSFSFACRYHGTVGMTGVLGVGEAPSAPPSP